MIDHNDLNEPDLWDHYEQCLRAFDWTYHTSDDATVWDIGEQQEHHLKEVRARCAELDEPRAEQLYYRHSFYHDENGELAYPKG